MSLRGKSIKLPNLSILQHGIRVMLLIKGSYGLMKLMELSTGAWMISVLPQRVGSHYSKLVSMLLHK